MNFRKSQNTLFNRTFVAWAILIVTVLVVMFVFKSIGLPTGSWSGNEATLLIDFGDMKRQFTGEVAENMTVLDALNASAAAGQIKLIYYVDADNNTRVTEISGYTADGNIQFNFYINSKKLDSSELNRTNIKPGDKITIRLE